MKTLFIDTASAFINVAIVEKETILCHHQEKNDNKLSERIIDIIDQVFQKSQLTTKQINKIIVTNGPGSFTGIRVGLSVAKTLAWDLKIPICSISTFQVMASGYEEKTNIIIPDRLPMAFCAYCDEKLDLKEAIYTDYHDFILKNKEISVISYANLPNQEIKTPKIDLIRIIKKFSAAKQSVYTLEPNYLKKLAVEQN